MGWTDLKGWHSGGFRVAVVWGEAGWLADWQIGWEPLCIPIWVGPFSSLFLLQTSIRTPTKGKGAKDGKEGRVEWHGSL